MDSSADFPTSDPIAELRLRLLAFYDEDRRDLPWRGVDDPYRVWVSEVMLQQTRVETVIPYYKRWMERFPELEDLAAAEQEEVLQEWKGLGYYSRARNLHRAAALVRERHGGSLPDTVEELKRLPGVGEYTAGAVASIAFGMPAPAVDGNARRVLSRLFDLPDPGRAELRNRAAELVDPDRPGAFNQAVMELGARICTPAAPTCPRCPVEELCRARRRGTVDERPAPRKRSPVKEREMAVAVLLDREGRTALVRRPEEGLLGGMWEFPARRVDDGEEPGAAARAAGRDAGASLPEGTPPRPLSDVSHAFSHLRVTYRPRLFAEATLPEESDGVRVLALNALDRAPLPVAQQKIGELAREVAGGG